MKIFFWLILAIMTIFTVVGNAGIVLGKITSVAPVPALLIIAGCVILAIATVCYNVKLSASN